MLLCRMTSLMDIGLDSKMPDKCYRLTKSHDGGRCLMINIPELKAKKVLWYCVPGSHGGGAAESRRKHLIYMPVQKNTLF